MSKTREQIVALVEKNKASLKFTDELIAQAKKAGDKMRLNRLESSRKFTLLDLGQLARVLAEMDGGTPDYAPGCAQSI